MCARGKINRGSISFSLLLYLSLSLLPSLSSSLFLYDLFSSLKGFRARVRTCVRSPLTLALALVRERQEAGEWNKGPYTPKSTSDDVTTTSVVCRCVNHYVLPAVTTRRRYRIVCVRYRYFLNKMQFIFSSRLIFTRRFYMHRRYLRASKSHSPRSACLHLTVVRRNSAEFQWYELFKLRLAFLQS